MGDPTPAGTEWEGAFGTLTPAQRRAVESTSPALCIVAGAGSGKTRVLTLRVARRIRDGSAQADHTVVCTFTRKAAGDLRQRLRRYGVAVAGPAAPGAATGPGVRAGTLHQLALTLLRRHALDRGMPPPVVSEQRLRLIRGIVADPMAVSVIEGEIGWAKARCLTPESYAVAAQRSGRTPAVDPTRVADAFAAYEEALVRRRCLDLDDVLVHAADLLRADSTFAEAMHWRYRHVSVDEFQDVNPAQYALVEAIVGVGHDLCAVGDPNQAIYGWNGADPTLLTRLPSLVPAMEVVHLDENHRSTPQVVIAAAAGLGPSPTAPPRSVSDDGPMAVVAAFDDEDSEAEGVASLIMGRSDDGSPWSDQAVLARTHDQLAVVGRALARAGVPYRMAPGPESSGGAPVRPVEAGSPRRTGAGVSDDDVVELATFHRAKGLEWTSVYVVGLEEGLVPIVHALTDEAQAEERRLLYVALSRASRDLHCSWARARSQGGGRPMERQPSRWLAGVARVSRVGTGWITPRDAGRRIAEIRASLNR
jgi:DNA helicase-2/ATP-dependent DNA helicase PcrA